MNNYQSIISPFSLYLKKNKIPEGEHGLYQKWLRFYLDFCEKYGYDRLNRESLPHFLKKLNEKNQGVSQQREARSTVMLYYNFHDAVPQKIDKQVDHTINMVDDISSQWMKVINDLTASIKVKHYSPKTLKAYLHWVTRLKSNSGKTPDILSSEDVTSFLEHLSLRS